MTHLETTPGSGQLAAVVAQSTVRGGAEAYLRMLYADLGIRSVLYGHIPGWVGERVELRLSPKWGRRTLVSGLSRLGGERNRLVEALASSGASFAHMQFKREQIGFSRAISRQMPVFWTEHGRMTKQMRLVLGREYAQAADSVAAVICVSREVAEDIASLNPAVRTEVIENPVDTTLHNVPTADERSAARAALSVRTDRPLAIWVGRLDEGKRPRLAAEIAAGWNGEILLAGDGPLQAQLHPNEGLRILGRMDPAILYQAADVLLFTSSGAGEGYPLVLLEAAAYGVPAVVSGAVPTFARIAGESGGIAVTEASLDEWRSALGQVISNVSRRRDARRWAESHDLKTWLDRHRRLFAEVL